MSFAVSAVAADATASKKALANGWDPKWFHYDRPDKPDVVIETPSAAQVDYAHCPPQVVEQAGALTPSTTGAKPRAIGPMDVLHLRYVDSAGNVVPALLCTPRGKKGPFPVVVAVHGLASNKAQVCAQVEPALVKRGFAVLAADM